MSVVGDLSRALQETCESGHPIAPVRDRVGDLATAYAVQRAQIEAWQGRGRKIIGLTAKAVPQQLGGRRAGLRDDP
jgi:2-keto-4-pentenoate hydratase